MTPVKEARAKSIQDVVSLRDHFDTVITDLRDLINAKLNAIEKSTILAADVLNSRLAGMNEFREALKAQSQTFVTRSELEAMKAGFDKDIRILMTFMSEQKGKASQSSVTITMAISVGALLLSLAKLFIK